MVWLCFREVPFLEEVEWGLYLWPNEHGNQQLEVVEEDLLP